MGHPGQNTVEVIVTIAEGSKASVQQIASELQQRGLALTAPPLETLGMISGRAEESTIEQLKTVEGVLAIEKAGGVQLAPPDSDLQ